MEDVEYTVYHTPTDKFKKMRFIGVTKVNKYPSLTKYLVNEIVKCRQYSKVNDLAKTFKLSSPDNRDLLRKNLTTQTNQFQDARYVHGVLVVEILENNTKVVKHKRTIKFPKSSPHYGWHDTYGNAVFPFQKFYAAESIAPKLKLASRSIAETEYQVNMKIRSVLYNKRLDQIVFDRTSSINSVFHQYAKSSKLKQKLTTQQLAQHLFQRVARQTCPKVARVERQLIADGSDTKEDRLTQLGIDYASDNRWEKASDAWKKAILLDKKYSPALHNLGVYYEKHGEIGRAMEEFGKAKAAGMEDFEISNQYDESLELFRPNLGKRVDDATIHTVSGSNWVQIVNWNPRKVGVGKVFPVYRSQLIYARDGSVQGTRLIETGKIKTIKKQGPYMIGRVLEFIDKYQVAPGDRLFTK